MGIFGHLWAFSKIGNGSQFAATATTVAEKSFIFVFGYPNCPPVLPTPTACGVLGVVKRAWAFWFLFDAYNTIAKEENAHSGSVRRTLALLSAIL